MLLARRRGFPASLCSRLVGNGGRYYARAAPPAEADAVVVGGGSLGASILYHLQKRGLNAVLLEKDKLTSGTTWHSAGMLVHDPTRTLFIPRVHPRWTVSGSVDQAADRSMTGGSGGCDPATPTSC